MQTGLDNPLAIICVVNKLQDVLSEHGLNFHASNDMAEYARVKQAARAFAPAPMFDPDVCELDGKAFWVHLTQKDTGQTVGFNAYRLDVIDTNLADWIIPWMSGLYMKCGKLMVPEKLNPPPGSRSETVRGKLVYHGELWLCDDLRGTRRINEAMTFSGHLIALLKWHPDAVWALVSSAIGSRGIGIQNGYPYVERSFLRWKVHPSDVPQNEWLLVTSRAELQHLVMERLDGGLMARV